MRCQEGVSTRVCIRLFALFVLVVCLTNVHHKKHNEACALLSLNLKPLCVSLYIFVFGGVLPKGVCLHAFVYGCLHCLS